MTQELQDLASHINTEHRAAETKAREAIIHARNAGEALRQAKAGCKHGEWLPWLREHFAGSEVTAQRYMRLAERWPELEEKASRMTHLSVRQALEQLAEPKEPNQDEESAAPTFEELCEELSRSHDEIRRLNEALQAPMVTRIPDSADDLRAQLNECSDNRTRVLRALAHFGAIGVAAFEHPDAPETHDGRPTHKWVDYFSRVRDNAWQALADPFAGFRVPGS